MNLVFFPNSFNSYGVLANVGSGAVPGRLPKHGFREGSGAGAGQGSGKVLEQVPRRFRGKFWSGRFPSRLTVFFLSSGFGCPGAPDNGRTEEPGSSVLPFFGRTGK